MFIITSAIRYKSIMFPEELSIKTPNEIAITHTTVNQYISCGDEFILVDELCKLIELKK